MQLFIVCFHYAIAGKCGDAILDEVTPPAMELVRRDPGALAVSATERDPS
jgi:hypothetical protein